MDAAATSGVYHAVPGHLMAGRLNLVHDPLCVMLLSDLYEPDLAGHATRADVQDYEVSGQGYQAGGLPLENRAVRQNEEGEHAFDADDVTWPQSQIEARYAVLYKRRGGPAEKDELVLCHDLGGKRSDGGPFVIEWDADGIVGLG